MPSTDPCFADALCAQRPYLLRFAARRVRDAALAEDMVQETLLAALQSADAFEQRSTLRTWLTGILQRRIADALRRALRQPVATLRDDADADGDDAPDAPAAEGVDWLDPQRRLEGREFLAALEAGLAALPPLAARIFALREVDGLSNAQAASALGLSARGSALWLHRARARLRDGLAAQGLAPAGRRVRTVS